MRTGLDRRKAERGSDYLERLWTDPLFEGATPAEVAHFAGCTPAQAARSRHGIRSRRRDGLNHTHALAVAEAIGWPLDNAQGLITVALERYRERDVIQGRAA